MMVVGHSGENSVLACLPYERRPSVSPPPTPLMVALP
jgi:hypothetical protein